VALEHRKVLIVVRTYPTPASKGAEVSCTAGVTSDGDWIRLFPIPYRFLTTERRFHKYQWIEADIARAPNDPRPESYKVDRDSIRVLAQPISSRDHWRLRYEKLNHLIMPSLCAIKEAQDKSNGPTLGLFKPKRIKRLIIRAEANPEWTEAELGKLGQRELWEEGPSVPLEKIPFRFSYEFTCEHPDCNGHTMICTDWEMAESFRRWRDKYGADGWEAPFRNRWEREMIEQNDTHFYVGTMHGHQKSWIIIGLFFPRLPEPGAYQQLDLFGQTA
jgi:hypothetical protein